jgi:hypothetical protein
VFLEYIVLGVSAQYFDVLRDFHYRYTWVQSFNPTVLLVFFRFQYYGCTWHNYTFDELRVHYDALGVFRS